MIQIELYEQHHESLNTRVYTTIKEKRLVTLIKCGQTEIAIKEPLLSNKQDDNQQSPEAHLNQHVQQINVILQHIGVKEDNLIKPNQFITNSLEQMFHTFVQMSDE